MYIDHDLIERYFPCMKGLVRSAEHEYARLIKPHLLEAGISLVRLPEHMFMFCTLEPEIVTNVTCHDPATEDNAMLLVLTELLQILEADHG